MHWQFAFQVSLPVFALLSLQEVPGNAVPFATPKQSKVTGVPAHWQFALHTSLIVFALPSLHEVPGKALPPGVPWQSIT